MENVDATEICNDHADDGFDFIGDSDVRSIGSTLTPGCGALLSYTLAILVSNVNNGDVCALGRKPQGAGSTNPVRCTSHYHCLTFKSAHGHPSNPSINEPLLVRPYRAHQQCPCGTNNVYPPYRPEGRHKDESLLDEINLATLLNFLEER